MQQALTPTPEDVDETAELLQHANAATSQSNQQVILMQQMLEMMKQMQCQMEASTSASTQPVNDNNNRNTRTRRNTSKYCWSHGACAHWGV